MSVVVGCADSGSPAPGPSELTLDTVAVLGTSEAEISPHFAARLAAVSILSSPEQAFVAAPTFEEGVLHAYDFDGRVVARWGGPGEGPGEFSGQGFAAIRATASRLWVASQAEARVTILEEGSDPISLALPWPLVDFMPISDSSAIGIPSTEETGLVRFATSGEVTPIPLPAEVWGGGRGGGVAGIPGSEHVLVFHPRGDLLEISHGGQIVENIVLPDTLFTRGDDVAPPRVTGVGVDRGVLWIHLTRTVEDPTPGMAFGPGTADQLMDSRFAAIDRATGEVLAFLEMPQAMMPVSSSRGLLMSHVFETELGDSRIAVLRPVLDPGGAR